MNVGEPHFVDEQTLLSARRVVPLETIDAKVRHRKGWLLGGAFAIAMMLGAASALVASYLKLRNVPNAAAEITEIETPAASLAIEPQVVANELPPAEETAQVENTEEPALPVAPKKAKRRAMISTNSDLVRPRVVRGADEDDDLQRIREAVLFDSWQERRARRAARRERRNRVDDHHDRDLSNLDEIFEGSRSPRRRPPY